MLSRIQLRGTKKYKKLMKIISLSIERYLGLNHDIPGVPKALEVCYNFFIITCRPMKH